MFEIEKLKLEMMDLEVEIKYIKQECLLMLSKLMQRPLRNTLKKIVYFF